MRNINEEITECNRTYAKINICPYKYGIFFPENLQAEGTKVTKFVLSANIFISSAGNNSSFDSLPNNTSLRR